MFVALGFLWLALLAGGVVAYGTRPRARAEDEPWPRFVWLALATAVLSLLIAIPFATIHFSRGDRLHKSHTGVVLDDAQIRGRQIFSDFCKKCHTLSDARAASTIGPNFDALPPKFDVVIDAVTNGRARGNGQMPRGLTDAAGARDVAAYLTAVAGR
ncbi:MAG: hypothetical protein J7513_04125 [Solirubrobacteraceae bacterium]|nr:hypothetical protein [Solirubrobacteraceae bacterium]